MRVASASALLALFLSSPLALAAPAPAFEYDVQTPIDPPGTILSADKVPGENPLEFCNKDRDADLLTIDKVDLLPNPPEAGQSLLITATGTFSETITKGAYVKLVVKYGLIRLISTTADLCEQVENVDLKCPLEKGEMTLTKKVDLPKQIPPGTYNVFADVYADDDSPITCLQATVTFGMPRIN